MLSIELEITLNCNRKCTQCNRHCNTFIDHSDSDISLDQVDRLCAQIRDSKSRIHHVNVVGGEPLIHPQFVQISSILYEQLLVPRLIRKLHMTTNGDNLHRFSARVLGLYTTITIDCYKGSFIDCYVAPIDTGQKRARCRVPSHCGIACNAYGFWPCGPGGAIARLFGLAQYQHTTLPQELGDFESLNELGNYASLCNLCQWSARRRVLATKESRPSESFARAIEAYQTSPIKWGLF